MHVVDFCAAEHANAIAKILALAQRPHCCIVTKRAMEDIVKLALTKAAVLEAVHDHVTAQKLTHFQMQESGWPAYILLPCLVDCYELYVKLQVGEDDDLMVIVSAHQPDFGVRGKKSHA